MLALAAKAPGSKFAGRKASDLEYTNGRVHAKGEPASSGIAFEDFLRMGNLRAVSGLGSSEGDVSGTTKPKFSSHSFGAHFVEVTWQPEIARLRVSRVVTVIDAGRILNPLAGRNQIEGAVVMGIGMSLFEETSYDPRNGAPINSSLADYIVAANADVPALEVHFVEYPDTNLNELGRARHRRDRTGGDGGGHRERRLPRDRRTRPRAADQDREPARLTSIAAAGDTGILKKPVRSAELAAALSRVLEKRTFKALTL